MATTEIEKLESRWRENPQGLTFAPLAEAYRKNGEVPRALDVLRLGLELHPDYIPASIVLGRCHLDQSDLPAAETAFNHVLGLDGENAIALKALADITERLGRLEESERWLRTLLSVDRSNDEARQQLGRIEQQRREAPEAAPAAAAAPAAVADEPVDEVMTASAPVEPAAESSEPSAPLTFIDAGPGTLPPLTLGEPAEEPAPPADDDIRHEAIAWVSPPDAAASADATPLVLDDLGDSGEAEARAAAQESAGALGLDFDDSPGFDAPLTPLPGLVGREADQLAAEAAAAAAAAEPHAEPEREPAEIADDFHVEMAEDIVLEVSGGTEYQTPSAAEQLTPRAEAEDPYSAAGLLSSAGASRYVDEDAPAPDEPLGYDLEPAAPVEEHAESIASEPAAFDEEALLVTETMAELYRQQGHTADALTVYRELGSRRPGDQRLRQKVAELEAELAGASRAAARPSLAARDTGGQSVADFFRGLLAARPLASTPGAGAAPTKSGETAASGAPTRPATDALSLSAVFGEDAPAAPPATPGVTFDDFFNSSGAPAGGGAARPERPEAKRDDLDQFHSWLQNLKR